MLGLVAALEPAQEGDTIITDANVCIWWMTNGETNARRDLDNLCRKAQELSLSKGSKVLWRACNQSFAGQYNEAFHSYGQHQQHDRSVAPQLTVVSAPPRHEAFQRMRGTSTLLGGCPSRRRDRTRQQFPDSPAMICDASSHRRRLLATCHVQAFMRRAEVRDGADQGHPLLQGQRAARQRPASACQRRQALTERRMQPLA